ncbi:MAG: MgtC/SapB family protein, partial [Dehalococcoidales bacterium]|nr:MgtC/SapB family protein [Dehalococcoidales bacterium]
IVEGLTTAATMWAVAGIGLAAGAGLYVASAVATAIILGILYLPHPIR